MHRVTTIDLDRIVFRLVGIRTRTHETRRLVSTESPPFLFVFVFLYLTQLLCSGTCMVWLLETLGTDSPVPFALLTPLVVLPLPLSFFGAHGLLSTEWVSTTVHELQTVEIELRGTEVRVDGVEIPSHALVVRPHQVRAPGLTLDFDPPLGPEILNPLSGALAQRDRLAAARAGGSVPPELTRLRARDSRDTSSRTEADR